MPEISISRRRILKSIAAGTAAIPLSGRAFNSFLEYGFLGPAPDRGLGLQAPSDCTLSTPSATAGPFYTPFTPRRTNLIEPDTTGEPLLLEGLVLNTDCHPIAGAIVDVWHCDEYGRYDNVGFRYRGHQYTDAAGSYQFKTIRPMIYSGRTEHIHVKVQGENTRLLTTQIYFPDRKRENSDDWIFKEKLLMHLEKTAVGWYGRFDFIL